MLTSVTGLVLLPLLAVEGYTLLDVHGMITLHIFLGTLLVGPVLLKVATTFYRFARYYRGAPAYVRKGPPQIVLRVLGPVVTLTSLVVLGTGVGLIFMHSQGGFLLFAHKASFVLWFGAMTVHVVGHVREAARSTWREMRLRSRGQRYRLAALLLALALGVGGAAALLPTASSWTHRTRVELDHRR
jgi:hypothetical protein